MGIEIGWGGAGREGEFGFIFRLSYRGKTITVLLKWDIYSFVCRKDILHVGCFSIEGF